MGKDESDKTNPFKVMGGVVIYECDCRKLRSMLARTLDEIEYQWPGIILDADIIEWNKSREKNEDNK